jgi:hypothetical protein
MGLRRRAPQNFYRYQFLDGNPEDKRQLGRDMHKWKDVIKTDFLKKKILWETVDLLHMAQDKTECWSL